MRTTLVATMLLSTVASAHPTGLSYLDMNVEGGTVQVSLDLPAIDLAVPLDLDANHNRKLEPADIAARQDVLSDWLGSNLRVLGDGRPCDPGRDKSELQSNMLLTTRAVFRCAAPIRDLAINVQFADTIGDGFSTFVHVRSGGVVRQTVVTAGAPSASFSLAPEGSAWNLTNIGRFLSLGMEHIFTGYDHILFLMALLMMGGRLRRIVVIATAFTAAHTITLSLATLGKVNLPGRLVESAIAASIAYVAVENFWHAAPPPPGREPFFLRWRWVVTFIFGLVHGFGFASALGELGLTRSELPVALASFNLGVELGQLVIITLAYPVLKYLGQQWWYRPAGVRYASAGIFAIALYWFVLRVSTG